MNETLTASFFESGAMPVLTKSKDTTALGQEGPTSTQWSLAGFATVGFSPATIPERTYLQPHYSNGVFSNVYLSAGQH